MAVWKRLPGLILLSISAVAHAQQAEVVVNKSIGFQVTKPADWHFLTAEANAENLNRVEVADPNLQQALAKYANAPVAAFIKYAEPYNGLNPSLKVNIRPAGALS